MTNGVFSEYEVIEQKICTNPSAEGSLTYTDMACVGSSEEDLEVKVITKKCRGVVKKETVKGTGNGTLTQSLHVPHEIYNTIYDMDHANLVDGVYAYGQDSRHCEFSLTQKVEDEDGIIKYKAYPRCIMESGPKRPVTNGQEEVPELSLTIKLLPDAYGNCMYEALESGLTDTQKSGWMSGFKPATFISQTPTA